MKWKRPAALGSVVAVAAALAVLAAAVAAPTPTARANVACDHGRAQSTSLSIEGNLYAVVRGEHNRSEFGGSGPQVKFAEVFGLIRKLGFKGTDAQLLRRFSQQRIPGFVFAGGSGSSDFIFTCRGSYRATALVRLDGRSITGTRFWLRQGGLHVSRAFCMPEQWVPAGALVTVAFRVPLARTAPVFQIDWDGNGKVDSIGPFQPGGAKYPFTERCGR